MPTAYDPNLPLIDPDIQAALEQGRQAQLAALLGQQQQSAVPRNMGEGIDALGKGLMSGLHNYMAGKTASANSAAMASALGGAQPMPFLGGPSTMTPLPSAPPVPMATAPPAGPPLASAVPPMANATPGETNINQFMAGIRAGEGVPSSTGTSTTGALGPYGLTGGFIKDWGSKLGLPTDKAAYAGNRPLQDQLAYGAAQKMYDKYGDWGAVAGTWLTGSPGGTSAPGNMSNAGYTKKVLGAAAKADPNAGPQLSPEQIAANIGPASHAVAPGLVAGPGVPSNLPPSQPGYRDNLGSGIGGSQGGVIAPPQPAPPQSEEEEEPPTAAAPQAPISTPAQPAPASPSMLSPTPMGAPQGMIPPGVAPQAGAAVVPPTPVPQPPVAPPPSAVAGGLPQQGPPPPPGQRPAPPGTHWAHLPGPPLLLAGDEGGGAAPQQGGSGLLAQLFGGGGQQSVQPQIRAPAPPAQMAAGLAPQQGGQTAAPPQGGLAAGLAPPQAAPPQQQAALSGNQAVYRQMYEAAAGPAARLQHAAAIAAASGNQALAQEYERQAAPYAAEMNKANELAVAERTEKPQLFTRNDGSSYLGDPRTGQPIAQISPAKPVDRPLTDQEAAAYGIKDKAGYAINPASGKPEQIAGTADKTDTAAIKEFEYGQAHPEFSKAPKWVPNASTNDLGQPVGGWVSPPNPADKSGTAQKAPTAGLTDEQKELVGTPNDHPMPAVSGGAITPPTIQLTDEQHAALNSVPDARRGMVQSILQRDMVAPTISAKNPLPAMLRQDVLKVMPNFDFASQPGQVKSKSEFLSGGPSSYSKQIEFGDTAVNHLLDYTGLSDKVPDSSEGLLSKVIGGPLAQKVGTATSGLTNEGLTAQNALINKANTFSGELTKYLTGSEGTEADRNAKAAVLSPSLPVAARKAAVLDLMNTVEGRKSEIQAAWHNAVGPNVEDFPVISKHAQASMDKIRAWATSGPGAVQVPGGAPQGGTAPTGPAPGAPMPAGPVGASMAAPPRNVAPQVTGAPPAAPKFNYDAIPKGQIYTAPDGKQRRKS